MTIDQKYIDLINADIDREIDHVDKDDLNTFLMENEEARALHVELSALCVSLESVEADSPPPHIRHVIMNSVTPSPTKATSPGFLQALLTTPALKYSATFAAGVLLTLSAISSDQYSTQTLNDVKDLVGTISEPIGGDLLSKIAVDHAAVVGTVSLRSAGPMLILDFDLAAAGPVTIEARYPDRKIWFNGFGQLESDGTTISATAGNVLLGMEGKNRYAVYLHNEREHHGVTIDLSFAVDGEVVHEANLNYDSGD
jgi:hypothetical protein